MKKLLFLFFVPYMIFSQENRFFNSFTEYSYFKENEEYEEYEEYDTKEKLLKSLLPFTVILLTGGINIGMREGRYKNNYQDNWWGTVNGAFTLGLVGTMIGYGISYGINNISDGKFGEMGILFGILFGLAGGVTMAFLPPFKNAFRENSFLYYSYPVLFGTGLTFIILDIWIGKNKKPNSQLKQFSLIKF